MFESARLKLTAWYVLIIFLVSLVFSVAFYQVSTREITRIVQRVESAERGYVVMLRQGVSAGLPAAQAIRALPPVEELKAVQQRLQLQLILINGAILFSSAVAGYFLAGKTLRPIEDMVDKQNQFISNASHELRTPLATLQAEMEALLLEKKISVKDLRHLIQSNLEEVKSLEYLANSLLQLTQHQQSASKQRPQKTPIRDCVLAAQKKVSPLARKKDITISLEVTDAVVLGNAHDLTEVFVVLLENAIKYSPPGRQVKVFSIKSSRDVSIAVQDFGPGIAQKDLPHIFERFYRADTSRSQTDGYGLGLSIAQEIVAAHKGELTATSEKNSGSTFTVTLPLA